jgi:O-antigen/teichoic acid export membrane protein
VTQPRGPLRTALSNFGWLSFGRLLGDAATFAFLVVISRWYGDSGLGDYTFAMAIALFYAVLADLGIYAMFLREFAHRSQPLIDYFSRVFSLGVVLVFISFVALLISVMVMPFPKETRIMILIIGTYQLVYKMAEGCSYAFLAAEQTHVSACLEVVSKTVAAVLSSTMIVLGLPLSVALMALPCVALGHFGAAYLLVSIRIGRPRLLFQRAELLAVLRPAGKYAASALQVPIHGRADVITLGLLLDAAAVGVYNAAFRIVMLLNVVANLASLGLFPLISKLYASSQEDVGIAYHATLRVSLLITLPAAAGLWLIAPRLIIPIFGPDFIESVPALRFLCWLVVVFPLRSLLASFLAASGLQATRAKIEWVGTAMTVIGCVLLVTAAGAVGAAIAVLLAEGIMVAMMMARLSTLWGWPDVGLRVLMSGIGIAGFCLPVLLWPDMPIVLVITLSIVIYVGVLALSADIRNTEYRLLRSALNVEPETSNPQVEKRTEQPR